jgi:hypothetical protein
MFYHWLFCMLIMLLYLTSQKLDLVFPIFFNMGNFKYTFLCIFFFL